jgi:DDE superfamily endonuclease
MPAHEFVLAFATKPQIALTEIERAIAAGVPPGVVLADAAYGDETAWREGITALGLPYRVGVPPATTVGASITGSSSRCLACRITKGAIGLDFITMPPCAGCLRLSDGPSPHA